MRALCDTSTIMAPMPADTKLRKIRTFADDVRRVHGDAPLPQETTVAAPQPKVAPKPITELASGSFRTTEDGRLDIRSSGTHDDATIVSEHRVKKWSFTQAVTDSVSKWWKETVAEMKADQQQATVAPVMLRTDVVKAAGSSSNLAPQEDHQSFIARLKESKQAAQPNAPAPSAQPLPRGSGWITETPVAPPPAPPPPAPTVPPPQPAVVPVAAEPEVPNTPPPPQGYAEEPPSYIPREVAEPEPVDESVEFRTSSSAPARVPSEDLQARYAADLPQRRATPADYAWEDELSRTGSTEFAARARARALERRRQEGLADQSTPFIMYLGMVIVVLFIVALLAAIVYLIMHRTSPAEVSTETTSTTSGFFTPADSLPVILIPDRASLLDDLTRRMRDAGGVPGSFLRYFFVYQSGASDQSLPAQAFIDTLRLRAPGSFLRTIDSNMMLGAYLSTPNAPYIVFRVRNYEEALGGMLQWEQYLNEDLAPLFGELVGSFGYTPQFTDDRINGIDARILFGRDGEVVTVYGFTDQNTLVITTSRDAFSALANALRAPLR